MIEGKPELKHYEPLDAGFGTKDEWRFPTVVDDGILDIEFVPRLDESPAISAIEVERGNF